MEKTDDILVCVLDVDLHPWKAGVEIKNGSHRITFNEPTGVVRIESAHAADEHWIVPFHHVRYMVKK